MSPLQQSILQTAKQSSMRSRLFFGFFTFQVDYMGPFMLATAAVELAHKFTGADAFVAVFAAGLTGAQFMLAKKGLSFMKVLAGRQVIDVNTGEPPPVWKMYARTAIACTVGVIPFMYYTFKMLMPILLRSAVRSTRSDARTVGDWVNHRMQDHDDRLANEAHAAKVSQEMAENPYAYGLHDQWMKTTVISIKYSQVWALAMEAVFGEVVVTNAASNTPKSMTAAAQEKKSA